MASMSGNASPLDSGVARGWNLDFNVTDAQLLAHGIGQHIIDKARLPLLRPGVSGDFERQGLDLSYVNSIEEARDRIDLAALEINNPDVKVLWVPVHVEQQFAHMGSVRP